MAEMWNPSGKTEKVVIPDLNQAVDIHLVPKRSSWLPAGDTVTSAGVSCFLKFLKALLIVSIVSYIVFTEVNEGRKLRTNDDTLQADKVSIKANQDHRFPKAGAAFIRERQTKSPESMPLIDTFLVREKVNKNPQSLLKTKSFLVKDKQGQSPLSLSQDDTSMNKATQDQVSTFLAMSKQDERSPKADTLDDRTRPDKKPQSSNQNVKTDEGVLKADNNMACGDSKPKQFTDIGYAFLGYNVFRGYPLAEGHDPGFTRPIFKPNYTAGHQTADCRYKVPNGLFVVPDVSCVTSFTSTTLQTESQFSSELSVSANVEGEGWGAKFSASAGYKQSSSEITTGESVIIISSAKCSHYFSKLLLNDHPEFDDFFLTWLQKLGDSRNSYTYYQFFDMFGTHFPTEVTFGARFVYQHKMSSKKYETDKQNGVNVDVEASYAGAFSVGGGMHMDKSQKEAASKFMKNVETKTITVGAAPPSDGNAMTWASDVASDPIPIAYKLSGMEALITEENMKPHPQINYKNIKNDMPYFAKKYCKSLLSSGELNFCEPPSSGILLKQTRLLYREQQPFRKEIAENFLKCAEKCRYDIDCKALTFCTQCLTEGHDKNACYMFKEIFRNSYIKDSAIKHTEWQSMAFSDKDSKDYIGFRDTAIIGSEREIEAPENAGFDTCLNICEKDRHCVAFTYCNCPRRKKTCQFYDKAYIKGLEKESNKVAIFV